MDDKDKAKINENLSILVSLTKWNEELKARLEENLFKGNSSKILDKIKVRFSFVIFRRNFKLLAFLINANGRTSNLCVISTNVNVTLTLVVISRF